MRAEELQPGDALAPGETVLRVSRTDKAVHVVTCKADGSVRRRRFKHESIVPTPDNPNPSQYEQGHPWARKSHRPWRDG